MSLRASLMTTSYEGGSKDSEKVEENEVLKQLEDLPLKFSFSNLLQLPKSTRCVLTQLLLDEGKHSSNINECATCIACCDAIHFTDEDLQLGSKPHNRPLFVTGYMQEQKLNRMLIDGGSNVNIMPKSTMSQLGINIDELSKSLLMIQGFNQG